MEDLEMLGRVGRLGGTNAGRWAQRPARRKGVTAGFVAPRGSHDLRSHWQVTVTALGGVDAVLVWRKLDSDMDSNYWKTCYGDRRLSQAICQWPKFAQRVIGRSQIYCQSLSETYNLISVTQWL